jgi:hypothetical protein
VEKLRHAESQEGLTKGQEGCNLRVLTRKVNRKGRKTK